MVWLANANSAGSIRAKMSPPAEFVSPGICDALSRLSRSTGSGEDPASPMRYRFPSALCVCASKPIREVCSVMPNYRLGHPWDMLMLDVLRPSIRRIER
jgi:hypothetical protein